MPVSAKNPVRVETFVATYMKNGGNATAAYRAAYPTAVKWKESTANSRASEMLALPEIQARIAQIAKAASEKLIMSRADVLREAMKLASFDIRKLYDEDGRPKPIHELDDNTAAAIQGVDIMEEWEGSGANRVFVGYTKKYKVADKNAAIDKLMKHFGLFEEDNKQKHSDKTDEELRARLRELSKDKK